jgi:hypothetical protein
MKTHGGDTLAFTHLIDADGDGWVTGSNSENVIDAVVFQRNPVDRPEAKWQRLEVRMRTYRDGRPESLMRLTGTQRLRNGRTETTQITDLNGEVDFETERRVFGSIRLQGADIGPNGDADTLLESTALFEVDRGENFASEEDDQIFVVDLKQENRLGTEKSVRFRLVSETGFKEGDRPRDGEVLLEAENRDGTEIRLTGEFSAGALSAEVTNIEGQRYQIRWSEEGDVLEIRKLP